MVEPLHGAFRCFSSRWSGENNWLFPPPYLIPKVLRHLQWSLADGTLVVPWRKTAPWWPLLILTDNRFRSEVNDFWPKANMFIPSVPGISMFSNQHQFFTFALKVMFL